MKIKRRPIKKGEIRSIIKNDLDGTLIDFTSGLNNTSFNLDIFYKNIKTLKLEGTNGDKLNYNDSLSEYNLYENKIYYIFDKFKISIMHELFHLASTIKTDKRIYSGFFQKDLETNEWIGYGLNEAYTAILDDRYFADYVSNKREYVGNSYNLAKYFVSMIESALGSSEMETFYSECNLYDLTKELSELTDFKSTIYFYRALDYMALNHENNKRLSKTTLLKMIDYALRYTAKVYFMIYNILYIQGSITVKEYKEFLSVFKKQLQTPIIVGKYIKRKNKVVSDEEFKELQLQTREKALKKYT